MNTPEKKELLQKDLFTRYAEDPIAADKAVFGRVAEADRRGFLRGAGLATMSALLGATIPFARSMPEGFIPVALAEEAAPPLPAGKEELISRGDRPLNLETPVHLLDDAVTPTERHFVRNHGTVPEGNPETWTLTIDGEVDNPLTLSLKDLQTKFAPVTRQLIIECGGNGRFQFTPPVKGNQWTYGAVGCANWTGVPLAALLEAARVKSSAVYTAHYGADRDLSDPNKIPVSRGIPIEKAMNPFTLVAFEMNGAPLHPLNGAPLRLVVPGWVGSASHKWLTRIQLRDVVHDGPGMIKGSYRMPDRPLEPGEEVAEGVLSKIITAMPVKSLITAPQTGVKVAKESPLVVQGHAWAGEQVVQSVDLSIDFGATWQPTVLAPPVNPYAWQHWRAEVFFPAPGYYEVWARATDARLVSQPFAVAWNPKGYLNNAIHRIAVRVA
ncbi:MAG: sulfite oxidase [Magnetococcales bacterium]|nr:sulfite oxidase [Magnetococcales bacterium]